MSLQAPSPLSGTPVWIMGSLETDEGMRSLPHRSTYSFVMMLCKRAMIPLILQYQACLVVKVTPQLPKVVGKRLG